MVNTNKIKGAIVSAGYSQRTAAKGLNITTTALNNKINNRSPFMVDEILGLVEMKIISIADIDEFFYLKRG